MDAPRYPAAHDVAPRIRSHFSQFAGADADDVPSAAEIEAVVDAAFWASLRREEGYMPRISLAMLPSERAAAPLRFARSLPLTALSLVRVAPAVERRGIHLGVWREDGELRVWGTTRAIPPYAMVLEVSAPGLLVVKHHRGDNGKYINVAVLEGERTKLIDDRARLIPDCPKLVSTLLGFDGGGVHPHLNVLVELAVSMRGHGRGGVILMVPASSTTWRESIVEPIAYAVEPSFTWLADLVRRSGAERDVREWQDELQDTVRAVAGLTAVDGATLITDTFDLLAFGAKISRRDGFPQVERASVTEPIEGGEADVVHPSRLGGTRHLSAAQFVHDQRDALALVASQDGRFTIFAWSPCEEMVHAHRVETLLL